jgi:hypothetical protein
VLHQHLLLDKDMLVVTQALEQGLCAMVEAAAQGAQGPMELEVL